MSESPCRLTLSLIVGIQLAPFHTYWNTGISSSSSRTMSRTGQHGRQHILIVLSAVREDCCVASGIMLKELVGAAEGELLQSGS